MEKLLNIVQSVLDLLPTSPFANVPTAISSSDGVAWLCWFFPVHDCLVLLAAWTGVIAFYYLASVLLRWVKAIQ